MKRLLLPALLVWLLSVNTHAQQAVTAANRFMAMLDPGQKDSTVFPFDGDERYNYHFVPLRRKGITFNDMNEEQKRAALDLMRTCMSEESFKKVGQIRQLDDVLKVLENRKPEDHFRDPNNYHISIFGIPSANTIWGWRFEGHHISFNFSFDKQTLSAGTPTFLGSNPAIVLSGPEKGKQVLKEETDKGFSLLHSLNAAQLQKAVIDTAPYKDILTFDKRSAMLGNPVGIRYAELTKDQQALMLQLIGVYVHRFTKLFAEDMLKEIQQNGLNNLWFAWAGSTEEALGKGTYYRVQGPTIVIEYDNTQNNANHVHSVLRDLKHDFGGDELLEHYKAAHNR